MNGYEVRKRREVKADGSIHFKRVNYRLVLTIALKAGKGLIALLCENELADINE